MIRLFLIFLVLLMGAVHVSAESYKWVDDKGTVNFTEDYSRIPKKYRKKARLMGDMGPGDADVSSGDSDQSKKDTSAATSEETAKTASSGKQEKKKVMYGGKSEDDWSKEFKKINDEIASVEGRIAERRDKLSHSEKLTRAQYLGTEYEIKDLETKLDELRNRLSALDEAATAAGVPYEIRK